MSEAITQTVKPERTCGGCTMCCRVMAIDADDGTELSANDAWCRHCDRGKGCTIYAERPKVCKAFRCGWLEGDFADEDRPDRSKIIALIGPKRTMYDGVWVTIPVLEFKECAPGALDTPRAKRMIASVAPKSRIPVAYSTYERGLPSRVEARGKQHRVFDPGWREEFYRALEQATAEAEPE